MDVQVDGSPGVQLFREAVEAAAAWQVRARDLSQKLGVAISQQYDAASAVEQAQDAIKVRYCCCCVVRGLAAVVMWNCWVRGGAGC